MQRKNIESIYRLSPTQEGILYQCLKSPDAGYYHSQFSCHLDNLNDAEKWHQVWSEILQQHAVLRTFFTWEKRDQPLQIVREKVQLPWQLFDWREFSEKQIEQKWTGLKRRDKDLGFNLSKAPLIRFSLIRISSEGYLFLVSFHHILLDGWSQRLLFDQALNNYAANSKDLLQVEQQDNSQLTSFEQFIHWLALQDTQAAMAHWSSYLKDFCSPTLISEKSGSQPTTSSIAYLDLTAAETNRLQQFTKQHQITLNNLFVGALGLLMANETKQSDVIFGTTVSGRPSDLPGSNQIAGMFINTLPMRIIVPPDQEVAQWLKQLQSAQALNLQYSHSSLNDIQKLARLPQGQALFDTILVVENLPGSQHADRQAQNVNQLKVDHIHYQEYSHYPLAILVDLSAGIKLIAIYQTQLIDCQKANRIIQQLASLLRNMAGSQAQTTKSLRDISFQSTEILPNPVVSLQLGNPNFSSIHQYIEHYAELNPEKIALRATVSKGEETLSYAELNQRANRLAHYLISLGFAEKSAIAVLLERSANTIVSFLAVLKTGAAYVPLDASHPSERIASILSQLNNSETLGKFAVITDLHSENTGVLTTVDKINIDVFEQQDVIFAQTNPALTVPTSALAYIIYTSGSTGAPKGVMISHQNLINSTLSRSRYYPHQPEVFLVLSSLATDSSVAGIYWSLCTGQSLVISATRAEQDLACLSKLIQKHEVTHLLCIPSLYFLLLENIHYSELASLKTVIVAGEACSATVIEQHQRKLPNTKLYNEYGPSEFTVWATVSELNNWQAGNPVPIGQAIANTVIYVMNEQLQPAAKGDIGELFLGGDNLALGYLDDAVKTQQKFVRNPFSQIENQPALLYRTGDLVRYCDEQNLQYVGRTDNQIKIRGNRLEPEEVESLLNRHPDVIESVVFLQHGTANELTPDELAQQLAHLEPTVAQQLLDQINASGS